MTVDLASLSVEELKALKRQWLAEARADGSIAAIGRVVRELGTRHSKKHGSNWSWSDGDITLGWDDWGGSFWASVGDRQVCYVGNGTSELFVPGPWMDKVWAANAEANLKIAARRKAASDDERRALLRQLGGA